MAISAYVIRLVELDRLIMESETGTSVELASKIGVSVRQVRSYLIALEELGKKPVYNRKSASYEYKKDSEWNIKWPK